MTHNTILGLLGSGTTPNELECLGASLLEVRKAMAIIKINGFKPSLNLYNRVMRSSKTVWRKLDKVVMLANQI
jgi:hypothetical protein